MSLSLEQAADMLGVSGPFLGQIERGEKKPSLETFEKLLSVLELSPDDLMRESAPGSAPDFETRLRALLRGQPERRKRLIFEVVRFSLRRLD